MLPILKIQLKLSKPPKLPKPPIKRNENYFKPPKEPYSLVYPTTCNCCKKKFFSRVYDKRCCSPECARQNSTYRKIAIPFQHNGKTIYLESSWEVEIANWLNERNIKWERPKHLPWIDSTGKKRRYFPDFYLPDYNLYLDPKNEYQIHLGKEKLDYISKRHMLVYGDVSILKNYIGILV